MKRNHKCILVADSARARLYTYGIAPDGAPGPSELVEIEDLVSPARRRRDSEIYTDSRPGLRQAQMGGPRHGVDDRREGERHDAARAFAVDLVEHATALAERHGRCPLVIVSSPSMLGIVRDALERAPAWLRDAATEQFDRDLTSLRPAQVHDWLTSAGVLPPRERLGL